jgi:hypothetical protein
VQLGDRKQDLLTKYFQGFLVKMVWIYRETDVTPHGCATNYAMVLQTIVFHAREVANKAC